MTNNEPTIYITETNNYSGILYYGGCPNDKQTIQYKIEIITPQTIQKKVRVFIIRSDTKPLPCCLSPASQVYKNLRHLWLIELERMLKSSSITFKWHKHNPRKKAN